MILQENAIVMHSVIGWKSCLGKWARVQESLLWNNFFHLLVAWQDWIAHISLPFQADGDHNSKLGITILGIFPYNGFYCSFRDYVFSAVPEYLPRAYAGEAVTVEDEVVVVNSIALSKNTLNYSVQGDIIL